MIERFKKAYVAEIFEGSGAMTDELSKMFDEVLHNELGDNAGAMDEIIQGLNEEHFGKKLTLEERQQELERRQEELEKQLTENDARSIPK